MDDTRVGTFISRADNLINAKVGGIYAVPFTTTPPLIQTLSDEISAFLIMRTLFTEDSVNKNDWILMFRESLKMLDEIAAGKVTLVDSTGVAISVQTHAISSNNGDYTPTFDMDDSEDQAVDADLLQAIEDARA